MTLAACVAASCSLGQVANARNTNFQLIYLKEKHTARLTPLLNRQEQIVSSQM
jgi:hypothetical protein